MRATAWLGEATSRIAQVLGDARRTGAGKSDKGRGAAEAEALLPRGPGAETLKVSSRGRTGRCRRSMETNAEERGRVTAKLVRAR